MPRPEAARQAGAGPPAPAWSRERTPLAIPYPDAIRGTGITAYYNDYDETAALTLTRRRSGCVEGENVGAEMHGQTR